MENGRLLLIQLYGWDAFLPCPLSSGLIFKLAMICPVSEYLESVSNAEDLQVDLR
jgi:hypothetical protein